MGVTYIEVCDIICDDDFNVVVRPQVAGKIQAAVVVLYLPLIIHKDGHTVITIRIRGTDTDAVSFRDGQHSWQGQAAVRGVGDSSRNEICSEQQGQVCDYRGASGHRQRPRWNAHEIGLESDHLVSARRNVDGVTSRAIRNCSGKGIEITLLSLGIAEQNSCIRDSRRVADHRSRDGLAVIGVRDGEGVGHRGKMIARAGKHVEKFSHKRMRYSRRDHAQRNGYSALRSICVEGDVDVRLASDQGWPSLICDLKLLHKKI